MRWSFSAKAITAAAQLLVLTCSAMTEAASPPGFDLRAAIEAAPAGATVEVPAGTYSGPLVVRKPVALIARTGAILDGGGLGNVVRIAAADVTLRGFTIRRSGNLLEEEHSGIVVTAPRATVEDNTLEDVLFGIYLKRAPGSVVRGNRISGLPLSLARRGDGLRLWYSDGCRVEGNTICGARDAVIWFSRNVRVSKNFIHHGRYGLHFMYSFDNTITENRLEDNSVGIYLMYSRGAVLRRNIFAGNRGPSGYGIGLKGMDDLVAEDNQCVGNRVGIYLDTSPSSIDSHGHFTRNTIAYNDVGIAFLPSVKRNIFRENSFLENVEQVAVWGSGRFQGNEFTVAGRGNFWSDYNGYDLDGDGIGDLPYRPQNLFDDMVDRHPRLRLLLFSPAEQAVQLAARTFPVFRPDPKFTDTAPLMRPPPLATVSTAGSWDGPTAGIGGGLLAMAAMVLAAGTRRRGRHRQAPDSENPPPGLPLLKPAPETSSRGDLPDASDMIVVSDLTKRFRRVAAVKGLSFQVPSGQVLALWGLNGAGKTTVIKCLLGLWRHEGSISIGGRDVRRDGKGVRQMIGYVPQEPGFHADLTARDALRFYGRPKGVSAERMEMVLREVGLIEHADKAVAALSGGMRKRLALASALLADPPLLVLDEATANLDATARQSLLALLREQGRREKTVVFTSHRIEEVQLLADRVVALRAGRMVFDGRPSEFNPPETEPTDD